MNKFTDTPKKKTEKVEKREIRGIIIKKGTKEFIKCPKCGWMHSKEEKVVDFAERNYEYFRYSQAMLL